MTTKELYNNHLSECCGCEACVQVCPVSIIKMRQDGEGFFYPYLMDEDKCIDCKRCIKVCPEKNRVVTPRGLLGVYSGYAKDIEDVKHSSSGSLATTISKKIIQEGGVVYGVRYSQDCLHISYSRATSILELDHFRGSKYAQSRKDDVYNWVLNDLKNGRKVLFIGLPCDIAALYNYVGVKNEELYTMELVCHGVTSPLIHYQYVSNEISIKGYQMTDFSVRYKKDGWRPYFIFEKFSNGEIVVKLYRPTAYGVSFIYLKRPSCNQCRFKIHDSEFGLQADLTVGDNHGVVKQSPSYNEWGSSVAFVHTEKGVNMLKSVTDAFVLTEETDKLINNNLALYKAFPEMKYRCQFSKELQDKDVFAAANLFCIKFTDEKNRIISIVTHYIKTVLKIMGFRKVYKICFHR